jgi:hypothetical protein
MSWILASATPALRQRFGKFAEEHRGEWGTNIAGLFYKKFENFTKVRGELVERLMGDNNLIEIAWSWLQNYGLELF